MKNNNHEHSGMYSVRTPSAAFSFIVTENNKSQFSIFENKYGLVE